MTDPAAAERVFCLLSYYIMKGWVTVQTRLKLRVFLCSFLCKNPGHTAEITRVCRAGIRIGMRLLKHVRTLHIPAFERTRTAADTGRHIIKHKPVFNLALASCYNIWNWLKKTLPRATPVQCRAVLTPENALLSGRIFTVRFITRLRG